ncbi:hypothetical protein ACFFRR_003756 [Megaselia abdita]
MAAKLLLLGLGCFVLSASAAKLDGKVYGGQNATAGQFPYQVSILLNNELHCGGSIIGPNIILTAAHCVYNYDIKHLKVVAGTTNLLAGNGVVRTVRRYVYHKYYKRTDNDMDYDIAIIWVTKKFAYSRLIAPISMPRSNSQISTGPACLSGFGWTGPNSSGTPYLQWAKVSIEPNTTCQQYRQYTARMICASVTGWPSSCPGDSGGPLVKGGLLVGVVSWGYGCGTQAPGFYCNVPSYRNWIHKQSGI